MPLQHTRSGLRLPDAAEEARVRETYGERSCVTLPGFLEPSLLQRLQARLDGARWHETVHDLDEPSTDLTLFDEHVTGTLTFLAQDPAFHAVVRRVTGCDPIGCFCGRVYRMDPHAGHYDAWHGDDDDTRMVTLSVNLSRGEYAGGVLELRERASKRIIHQVANTGPGDAILFRIDHALEHRVSEVEGDVAKIAYAGWFQREPVVHLGGLVRP